MANEVKPVGETCNLRCRYCYEAKTREAAGTVRFHKKEILGAIAEMKSPFHLFGGEALLLPLADLEELWKLGYEKFKSNGVQTNGTLITDAHIALFKKYNVHPGISIDGPGALNDIRWAGTLEATRAATAKTEAAIDRCLAAGIVPSLITCLHKGNCATDAQFEQLLQWFRDLSAKGITAINYHLMESNGLAAEYRLPDERMIQVLMRMWTLVEELPALRQNLWTSILGGMQGDDRCILCTFRPCDTLNTPSCRGTEVDGKPSNCGHVYKTDTVWMPAPDHSWIRAVALYQTPQEDGGCQGCPYFLACFGYCPASAGDHDWRSRSEHCPVLKALFAEAEKRLAAAGILPISRHPKRAEVEAAVLAQLVQGRQRPSVYEVLHPRKPAPTPGGTHAARPHQDHYDAV